MEHGRQEHHRVEPRKEQRTKWELPAISFSALPKVERSDYRSAREEVCVPVEFEGTVYEAVCTAERFADANFSTANGGPIGRLEMMLYKGKGENREQASSFKAALNHRIEIGDHSPKDGKPHIFWRIHTRLVFDESMRGRGFGKLNLALMEKAMVESAHAMGDVKPEWIEIRTMLGALANMIVDRAWLAEMLARPDAGVKQEDHERLWEKALESKGFLYRPVPSQEQATIRLLQKRTQKLEDASSGEEEIVFVRPMGDTSVEQLFD